MKSKTNCIMKASSLLLLLTLAACATTNRTAVQVPVEYREKVVERMVAVQSPADSANLLALLECDSLNRVVLKQLSEAKGSRISTSFTLDSGLLSYKLRVRPELSYAKARDSIVYREVAVSVPVETVVNRLTWWQSFWVRVGKASAALMLIGALILFVKSKFKIF